MADHRLEPRASYTPPPPPPPPDEEFHCPNCMFLGDAENGFWACQNLCIRE